MSPRGGQPVPDGVRRLVLAAAVAGASSAVAAGVAAATAATVFARRVVTPDANRPENVEIVAVSAGMVTLRADADTTMPGRYGLWQDGVRTHVRVGEVSRYDTAAGTVERPVIGIDAGQLRPGRARLNQYYYAGDPFTALGLPFADITIEGDSVLHGWVVPGAELNSSEHVGATVTAVAGARVKVARSRRADLSALPPTGGTWAILVHGRGATREECLRAIPVLHRLGVTSLVAGYRTTAGLPLLTPQSSPRYHLGDTEWRDVEAAIVYAAEHGAQEVVLFGWSMGGAIVMQTVARSWTADRVKGIVLDAPVMDWRDTLAHQARMNKIPPAVGKLGQTVLSHRSVWRLAGTEAPVDLDRLDWVTRASEVKHPILLIHSRDDEYVPSGPSEKFAAARPDLATYVNIEGARHCKEWNVDQTTWESAVARFLLRL
ncbi:alpha/beta hydrolase [Kineosporia succinea]|uniref:Alpha-beta hydrolase superfamily lysophospholipase n=1 Tax=Kineosporia succinea TaxID=84632 RepID=A0ABT9NVP9_9ACTN|nr:alpha/beta fold hydrolase [Kineosporia succinea]MDP9824499.1 alpha-beta hydrolase superfamily lysophospholipase [Kineosporia succinea]